MRMGEDKYLLKMHGVPQYVYLYELLQKLNIPAFISCNQKQEAILPSSFPRIVDLHTHIGPIGGLTAAIQQNGTESILLVACDLIHLEQETIQKLISENDPNYDVVTFRKKESPYFETTITIYNPGSFHHVTTAVKGGNYSLQGILQKCSVKEIMLDDESTLSNANIKEDLI